MYVTDSLVSVTDCYARQVLDDGLKELLGVGAGKYEPWKEVV